MARAFDLRPLEFGDHISRAFSLFVRHWLVLARWFLLAWFVPMVAVVLLLHTLLDPYAYLGVRGAPEPEMFDLQPVNVYSWLLRASALAFSQWFAAAGIMYIGARCYVGATPGLAETARAVLRRGGAFTGVAFVQLIALGGFALIDFGPAFLIADGAGRGDEALAWLYAVFLALPAFFLLLALFMGRYGLAPCCVMLDDADSSSAFFRSQTLSKGFRWRVYMLMLVALLLTGVPGLWSVLDLAGLMGGKLLAGAGMPLAGDLLWLLWQGILAPLFFLPLVVFFFDQRSRKEGYDIAVMARNFGIDEAQLLRHHQNSDLGYAPRGWKGGRLHPRPQPARPGTQPQPWPAQQVPQPAGWPAQWARPAAAVAPAPQPSRAVTYRPPVPRKEPK